MRSYKLRRAGDAAGGYGEHAAIVAAQVSTGVTHSSVGLLRPRIAVRLLDTGLIYFPPVSDGAVESPANAIAAASLIVYCIATAALTLLEPAPRPHWRKGR
jgi:hypothetical protein